MSSSDTGQEQIGGTSFLGNLKNKIVYKANKFAYDPNANQYAIEKQQEEQQEEQKQQQEQAIKEQQTQNNSTVNQNNSTVNQKGILQKIVKKFRDTFRALFVPFLALMMTMVVVNDMIMYSIPIRVLFFIFTLTLSLFLPIYPIVLAVLYFFKALYGVYINTAKPGPEKVSYLPYIFALLPIKLTEPESKLGRIFMYPFTYPKSERGKIKLEEIMTNYEKSLQANFKEFDKYKSMPIFSKLIQKVHYYLQNMHDVPTTTNSATQG